MMHEDTGREQNSREFASPNGCRLLLHDMQTRPPHQGESHHRLQAVFAPFSLPRPQWFRIRACVHFRFLLEAPRHRRSRAR